MSDPYEKAYLREKQARLDAEKLLDEKTREVQSSIDMIQHQFNDLMLQKQESDFLLAITKLAQLDDKKELIVERYLSLNSDYLRSKCCRHVWHLKEGNVKKSIEYKGVELPDFSDDIYKSFEGAKGPEVWLITRVVEMNEAQVFVDNEIHSILFLPIRIFGKVKLICEFYFSENDDVESLLASCEAASYQLGLIIERISNKEKLLKSYEEIKVSHEELKKTQSQLVQSEKMASLGQLAAGVAHEINNPIGFVMSNIGTLKEYSVVMKNFVKLGLDITEGSTENSVQKLKALDEKEDFNFIVNDIDEITVDCLDGLRRVKDIVANLKSFSRSDEEEMAEVDINQCIENTIKVVWNELKYKATLHRDYQSDLPLVKGHEGQIAQVIMNMLVNAAHAIEDRGDIFLCTLLTDRGVQIQIQDTGKGMSEKVKAKIFDPFYTTKGVSEGTGLGLSISFGIIESHGGTIRVDSKEGEGTIFKIILPVNG